MTPQEEQDKIDKEVFGELRDDLIKEKERQRLKEEIEKLHIISTCYYGEDDGTNSVKLTKYLIDKKEVLALLEEKK